MPVLPSYRNQPIDLMCKSVDWFLHEDITSISWVKQSIYLGWNSAVLLQLHRAKRHQHVVKLPKVRTGIIKTFNSLKRIRFRMRLILGNHCDLRRFEALTVWWGFFYFTEPETLKPVQLILKLKSLTLLSCCPVFRDTF